mgnify:FL=1
MENRIVAAEDAVCPQEVLAPVSRNRGGKTSNSVKRRETALGWCMALPPVIGFLIFTFVPLIISFVMSLNEFSRYSYSLADMTFCGFDNYVRIFTDSDLWKALGITLLLCLSIPFEIFFGLLIANLLRKPFFGRRAFRVIFFLPNICSVVALAFVWTYMYSPQEYGLFNTILSLFGAGPLGWTTDPNMFLVCIIIMTIWNVMGYDALMFQAQIGNINQSLYESADLDGANCVQKFFRITVPMATPMIFYLALIGVIGAMQSYARIDAMDIDLYGMGPEDSGLTLVGYMMRAQEEPIVYGGLGISAATSFFLGIIIAVMTLVNLKVSKKWVHYND